jgi:hypothetical protein
LGYLGNLYHVTFTVSNVEGVPRMPAIDFQPDILKNHKNSERDLRRRAIIVLINSTDQTILRKFYELTHGAWDDEKLPPEKILPGIVLENYFKII